MKASGLLATLALTLCVCHCLAEPYLPPQNFEPAPQTPAGPPWRHHDPSLACVYVEPHDVCFDIRNPIRVTLVAVNRSSKPMIIDWDVILNGLVLSSRGPGKAAPLKGIPYTGAPVHLGPMDFAATTVNLRSCFAINGPSVFRVQYRRPLADGRTHISCAVQFLVEDDEAVQRLTARGWDGAPPIRRTLTQMLLNNPFFSFGVAEKSRGRQDPLLKRRRKLPERAWLSKEAEAWKIWRDGLEKLTLDAEPPDRAKALTLIVERLLLLGGHPNCPWHPQCHPYAGLGHKLWRAIAKCSRDEQIRIHLKLARCRQARIARASLRRLSSMRSTEALDLLLAAADSKDAEFAHAALSSLGNYRFNRRISEYLKKKMGDPDPHLALDAAIITCYSGDWSGFPMILQCVSDKDPAIRKRAIRSLVDFRYRSRAERVVPLLLKRLHAEADAALIDRTIETLGNYPSTAVLRAIHPYLKHEKERVRTRARLVVEDMTKKLKQEAPEHL